MSLIEIHQKLVDELRVQIINLRSVLSRRRDRVRELEAENTKLREVVRWVLESEKCECNDSGCCYHNCKAIDAAHAAQAGGLSATKQREGRMGVHKNVGFLAAQFPRQGRLVGKIVEVVFNYDTLHRVQGTIVRDDLDEPYRTIIHLTDGRYVLGTECQYSTSLAMYDQGPSPFDDSKPAV